MCVDDVSGVSGAAMSSPWQHNASDNVTLVRYEAHKMWGKHLGMAVVAIFAVLGNSLLIYTIARHRHLHTVTNIFILSLAAGDLLFGFPTIPLHIAAETAGQGGVLGLPLPTLCLAVMSMTSFQVVITVTTLLALTLERYVCFLHPLKHRQWAQKRRVLAVAGGLWGYALLFGALPLFGWNALRYHNPWEAGNTTTTTKLPRCSFLLINTGQYAGAMFLLHTLPVCFLIPFLYTRMFMAIRKFVARKTSHSSLQNGNSPAVTNGNHLHTDLHQQIKRRSSRRSLRLLIVMAMYGVFSWLPTMLWYFVATRGFTKTYSTTEDIQNVPLPLAFYQTSVILGFANSAINPYIYGLGNVPIRMAFCAMFHNGRFCGIRYGPTPAEQEMVALCDFAEGRHTSSLPARARISRVSISSITDPYCRRSRAYTV